MQCPVCQNEVVGQAAFCNHCGASLAAAAPAASIPTAAAAVPASGPPVAIAASTGLTPNTAAAISYLTFIPAVLFLIVEPYNKMPLVRFHCFQCFGLYILGFVLWVLVFMAAMLVAFIPIIRVLVFLTPLLYIGLTLGMFILWLMAIIKASKGEWFKLPLIGDFAMKMSQG